MRLGQQAPEESRKPKSPDDEIETMNGLSDREKFIEMRAKGISLSKIARIFGKRKKTVIDWDRELEGEVANRKAEELDAIAEKYSLDVISQAQTCAERLKRMRDELETRPLSDIPTGMLSGIIRKDAAILSKLLEPRFQSSQEIAAAKRKRDLDTLLGS